MARVRQARSIETRARLVEAAAEVIAEHGIDGASVDAIATAADRTSGSLYSQFGSKDGLIVALLDGSKDLVAARMSTEIAHAATLDERLAALWRNFAHPPDEARDWVRFEHELWVWATRNGNDAARDRLSRRYRHEFAPLADLFAEWTAEGLIDPPLPPDRLATVVVAALLGLEMNHRLDPRRAETHMVVTALRALLGARDDAPCSESAATPGGT